MHRCSQRIRTSCIRHCSDQIRCGLSAQSLFRGLSTAAAVDSTWLRSLAAASDGGARAVTYLQQVAQQRGLALDNEAVASELDALLAGLQSFQRDSFLIPKNSGLKRVDHSLVSADDECVYLVGNSLGLQPRHLRQMVNEELDAWATIGVNAHFDHHRAWMHIDELVTKGAADVVGALESEVAVMNGLTVNLHLLFTSFYRPAGRRNKILYESHAFGSDYFAFKSQAEVHGLDPAEALLPMKPRNGEVLLRTEDIIQTIEEAGDTLATVCLGTIQYYTGQYFDVEAITAAAHRVGAKALWDCAHAAGNVDLKLHEWGVDGAVWCSYKYMNSGPGGIGGFFVHEKHHGTTLPILSGWWGQQKSTRFNMAHDHLPEIGASAWRLSNPPVLQTVSLLASLDVFGRTSMVELRGRSLLLTGYLHALVDAAAASKGAAKMSVITPRDGQSRGCQISLQFAPATSKAVFDALESRGVVVDHRKPDVIRVAPAPLYNTFMDVFKFARFLRDALVEVGETP